MLGCCWASVVDDGPTPAQHWPNASCLLGYYHICSFMSNNIMWINLLKKWLCAEEFIHSSVTLTHVAGETLGLSKRSSIPDGKSSCGMLLYKCTLFLSVRNWFIQSNTATHRLHSASNLWQMFRIRHSMTWYIISLLTLVKYRRSCCLAL